MGAHSKPHRPQRRKLRLLVAGAAAAGIMGGTLHMAGALPINPGPPPHGEDPWADIRRTADQARAFLDQVYAEETAKLEDEVNVEWAQQKLDEIAQGIADGTIDPDDPDVQQQQLDLLDMINGAPDEPTVPTLPEDFDEVDDGAGEDVDDVDRDHLMTLDDYFTFDWNGRGWVG